MKEWKKVSNGHNAIVTTTNKGIIILSEVLLEKGNADPISGEILTNIIQCTIE